MNQSFGAAAPVTTLLLGINVALYIFAGMQSKNMGVMDGETLLNLGGSMRELLWEGDWIRIVAPSFLHANILHILFNMSTLMYFGPRQEREFGSSNFASLYLLSGICGFCCSQIIGGRFSVGASGSLFGLMGADIAMRVLEQPAWRNAWRSSQVRTRVYIVAFFVGLGFVGSWLGRNSMSMMGSWDNWCHLGGAIIGFVFGIYFESWRRRGRLSIVVVALPLVGVALLIVAARWSVFSPYYHMHQGVVAAENKNRSVSERHFEEAQKWASRWGMQKRVEWVRDQWYARTFTLDNARRFGYRYLDKIAADRTRETQ